MTRHDTFTFRVNQAERGMLEQLSRRLQRSQSDVLRWLIREAARVLDEDKSLGEYFGAGDEARNEQ